MDVKIIKLVLNQKMSKIGSFYEMNIWHENNKIVKPVVEISPKNVSFGLFLYWFDVGTTRISDGS